MATALLVLSSILVGGVWPLLMEQFSVRPNAADVERPYIERNIAATRQAYRIGSDWVDYLDYPGVGTKSPRDVPADVTTIANARLLDPNVLSRTFTQQQQLKNFYGFPERIGHRPVPHRRRAARLHRRRPRTVSEQSHRATRRDWINRHTVYTHGNGFVAAPANRVNAAVRDAANTSDSNSGYPIYTVSDIASQGSGRQTHPGRPTPHLLRRGDRAGRSRTTPSSAGPSGPRRASTTPTPPSTPTPAPAVCPSETGSTAWCSPPSSPSATSCSPGRSARTRK